MSSTRFLLLALLLLLGSASAPLRADAGAPAGKPQRGDVLFWNQAQRESRFRAMQQLFPYHLVRHAERPHRLLKGRPLTPRWQLDGRTQDLSRYMAEQHLVGLMVLQRGRIRLERYAAGFGPHQHWTSFSLAKSFTSTLLGVALHDGHIHGLDDPLSRYIPQLAGGAYAEVSVRQLLEMRSGVRWNEDYADPHSDVAQMYSHPYEPGTPRLVSYMKSLGRAAPPGARWSYNTGETDLLGILVQQASGRSLADYLTDTIWRRYGMADDAYWLKDADDGLDTGGSGLSASLADYARMGQFMLDGGRAGGDALLADDWIAQATRKQADIGSPGMGYGYQWWTYDDGRYAGIGIFGQLLQVDPRRQTVIVQLGAWPVATGAAQSAARRAFVDAIAAAIDAGD